MKKLCNYIEHTILKTDATIADIEKLANDAIKHNFFGVCINPNYIKPIKELLEGSEVKIVTVVNFPLASNTIETTLFQTSQALEFGADEIDTVLNVAALKNKDYKKKNPTNDLMRNSVKIKNPRFFFRVQC